MDWGGLDGRQVEKSSLKESFNEMDGTDFGEARDEEFVSLNMDW